MNLFFLFTDFYLKLFLHCNPKRSYFFVICFIKTQPFVKRKPVKTEKILERTRSVLGRFYCINQITFRLLKVKLKTLCTTYSEYVLCSLDYVTCKAYAPSNIAVCATGLADAYFTRYLTNGTVSGKTLMKIKCVFWFRVQLLSETFLIVRRTERERS
jgi:hypothetical protein